MRLFAYTALYRMRYGTVAAAAAVALGILFSLGSAATAQQPEQLRLEIGPQLTQAYLPVKPVGSVQYQPGFGVLGSVNLRRGVGLDAGFSVTPTVPITATTMAGSRLTEVFLGTRLGFGFGRIEIYGKARPGLSSFGGAILHVVSNAPNLQFEMGRLTEPALDVGGIVEVRISRRLAARYDAGDTLIRYGRRSIDVAQPPASSKVVSTLQLGAAFVFRF
jgi:hypothetical protein